jgi:hypothetical protein
MPKTANSTFSASWNTVMLCFMSLASSRALRPP